MALYLGVGYVGEGYYFAYLNILYRYQGILLYAFLIETYFYSTIHNIFAYQCFLQKKQKPSQFSGKDHVDLKTINTFQKTSSLGIEVRSA